MTDAELKEWLEEWIKDFCNDAFETGFPGGVKIFLDRAFLYVKDGAGEKESESLGDYSITLAKVEESGFPPTMMSFLRPYRRLGRFS